MGFVLFCAVLAGLIQLLALSNREKLPTGVSVLLFCLMELIPLGAALYFAVARPERGFFGWRFGAALCLWIAGAFWRAVPPLGSWTAGGGRGDHSSIPLDT